MQKRYLSLWFPYLMPDWYCMRRPDLRGTAFAFANLIRGRKIVTMISAAAADRGIAAKMTVADARALVPDLGVFDEQPGREARLLKALGRWCIRYSPLVATDPADGLFLDISGCSHLWGGEAAYLNDLLKRLRAPGYTVYGAIADTPGAAWAVARFGTPDHNIVKNGAQAKVLVELPAAALRLEKPLLERLSKLGLAKIGSFINMPRSVLRRRFGEGLLERLAQALGQQQEYLDPVVIPEPFQERLPCLEPIRTAAGIEIAIKRLLESLCTQLAAEGAGLRKGLLTMFRVDGKSIRTTIGTNQPVQHQGHLFKLFELKIPAIAPGMGIELFILEATRTEKMPIHLETLWKGGTAAEDAEITLLLDRIACRVGPGRIHRYVPDEHFWPERSLRLAASLTEKPELSWPLHRPRPTQLLTVPEKIEVTAPIPDYPPMLFRYQGKTHEICKADGPERIEREWWLDHGEHRDYYQVEDREGRRYWLFRSGHYKGDSRNQWFIHGFFA
ncbi:nucleotidyltransferase [Pedobacter yulinensis]|uniref:Nucleotidyltransferase n=1 Tax=Pedobacter yulinensis TaxID=2126353 RepID=A0A2T3HK88_9SPHI|nr:DNA polymerase Y family protein [Pedobacter yulinensis]PST82857.1 nucleotidyltransferase [Pedobacter yulinensis]